MIYLTGDVHRGIQLSKLNTTNFPEQKSLTKEDVLIILGDFGAVWDGSKEDEYWLKWFNSRPYTTLFLEGNHENHDLLAQYPVVKKFGGKVHQIKDSVFHLMRGEIYEIEQQSFFVMGGAESHDFDELMTNEDYKTYKKNTRGWKRREGKIRIIGKDWWEQELPSKAELSYGWENLEKQEYQVDFILSHCTSNQIEQVLSEFCKKDKNSPHGRNKEHICSYFSELEKKVSFNHWYFGHYHMDIKIDEKHTCLYQKVLQL